jgi:hypothetical protein
VTTPEPQQLPRDLNDKFIRHLNVRGYQPILVPHARLLPPMVCLLDRERGRYEFRNELAKLLPRPAPELDFTEAKAPEFSQAKISSKGGKVSVGFLASFCSMFGLGASKINVSAEADNNNSFNFQNVIVRSVLTGPIESALQSGVKPEKLGDKDDFAAGRVHIAYDFLYARKFEMLRGANVKGEFGAGADGGAVGTVAVDLHAGGKDAGNETYGKGDTAAAEPEPAAFAFRVAQVSYDEKTKRYKVRDAEPRGAGESEAGRPERKYLYDTGQVFSFGDSPKPSA